jgi:hypothetical protein
MSPDTILTKSSKGLEEIEARHRRLHPRLRQVLVRVDGTRTFGELVAEAGAMGPVVAAQLAELVREGFVSDASRPLILDLRTGALLKIQLGDLLGATTREDASALRTGLQRCRTMNDLHRWVDWAATRLPGLEPQAEPAQRFHHRAREVLEVFKPSDERGKALGEFPQVVRE